MKTVREILIEARALIADPARWTKGTLARNATRMNRGTRDPDAVCWCSIGAVDRCGEGGGPESVQDACDSLERALPAASYVLSEFNDDPATTHADVLALFDRAIAAEPT